MPAISIAYSHLKVIAPIILKDIGFSFFSLQLYKRAPKKIPSALASLSSGNDMAKSMMEFRIFMACLR